MKFPLPDIRPSKMERVMLCPGSLHLERGLPDASNFDARRGSAIHEVSYRCLTNKHIPEDFLDASISIDGQEINVDSEMVALARSYVDYVNDRAAPDGIIDAEIALEYGSLIGLPNAVGTADCVIRKSKTRELLILDLKTGRQEPVQSERNYQISSYGLGGLNKYGIENFNTVELVIYQGSLNHVSSWTVTTKELLVFAEEIKAGISAALQPDAQRIPGRRQCRYCKAKAICPELATHVKSTYEELQDVNGASDERIAKARKETGLISDWCAAIEREAERRLLAGRKIDGFKLVKGRRGSRRWSNPDEVIDLLKAMRLRNDKIYQLSLVSPSNLESLVKTNELGKRQWNSLQPFITQSEQKPIVVPIDDAREAISLSPVVDHFDVVA